MCIFELSITTNTFNLYIMSYTYRVSVSGENIKESNTWANIIRYAKDLAKSNKGQEVQVKHSLGHNDASFVWCNDSNDIVPSY